VKIEEDVKRAEAALQKSDPKLGELIELQKPVFFPPRTNYFLSLCRSIVGQQVSVASAAAIFSRLESVTALDPVKVAKLTDRQVKEIGLSRQKTGYIKDLAQHFIDNPRVYHHLGQHTDEQVIEELTEIKGIGLWTAQMFLMFSLTRLDVFAPDDAGIQRAMMKLYGWKKLPERQKLEKIAENWRPYRTVASWHLWRSLQNSPL